MHRVGSVAAGQLMYLLDAFLAALGDDVGGAELATQIGAIGVAAHQDDLLGTEPLGGQHRTQTYRAVSDTVTDGPGWTRAVTAPWWPVENTSDSVSSDGISAESSATGSLTSVPWACGTRTASPWPPSTPGDAPTATVAAGGLQALLAEVAGVVRPHERCDHQVAALQAGDVSADVLDDADELVAHPPAPSPMRHRPVRPQVAAADAGGGDADDGVGGLAQDGVGHVLDPDVAGFVHDGCSHGHQPTPVSGDVAVPVVPGTASTPQRLPGATSEGRVSWLAAHEASNLRPSAVGVLAAAV